MTLEECRAWHTTDHGRYGSFSLFYLDSSGFTYQKTEALAPSHFELVREFSLIWAQATVGQGPWCHGSSPCPGLTWLSGRSDPSALCLLCPLPPGTDGALPAPWLWATIQEQPPHVEELGGAGIRVARESLVLWGHWNESDWTCPQVPPDCCGGRERGTEHW